MTEANQALRETVEDLSDAEVRELVRILAERSAGADAIQVASDQLALTGRVGDLRDPADVEAIEECWVLLRTGGTITSPATRALEARLSAERRADLRATRPVRWPTPPLWIPAVILEGGNGGGDGDTSTD